MAVCLLAGVPIAFCFGLAPRATWPSHQVPLTVMVGRMDEGMSSLILVSVPVFVLLGCVLDATGMGKAIVDFLASLLGHVKAGMSYVLLGSLFIVSGISGCKVSDMATVAPALFPEMKRRGHKPREMVALLATGAAMADTVPPEHRAHRAGLGGRRVHRRAVPERLRRGDGAAGCAGGARALEGAPRGHGRRAPRAPGRHRPVAAGGRAGAGAAVPDPRRGRRRRGHGHRGLDHRRALRDGDRHLLYGGIGPRRFYAMLVETAALSGAVLMILGTALAMAWAITQIGRGPVDRRLHDQPARRRWGFMAVTIVIFLALGCVLEGLPALLLMAPLMFPIAARCTSTTCTTPWSWWWP